MDQRQIVAFLRLKGLSTKSNDVHAELVQVLGSGAIAYSTVTTDMQNDAIFQNEPEAEDRAVDQCFWIRDNAIMAALEMSTFASIRQNPKIAIIPPPTVFRRLTKWLHIVLKRLPCVSTPLTCLRRDYRQTYQIFFSLFRESALLE
jgi:hypothetical protein